MGWLTYADCHLEYSNYHKKQNTLTALRKKAAEKNPDEFYYKMVSTQLQVGPPLLPSPPQALSMLFTTPITMGANYGRVRDQ